MVDETGKFFFSEIKLWSQVARPSETTEENP